MANPDVGAVTMGITGADHWLWWEHGGEKLWRRGQGGSRESRRQSNDSQARKQRNVLSLAGRQSDTLSHSGWQKQHPQQAREVKQCPQCHQRGKLITILILSKAKQWGIIRAESHNQPGRVVEWCPQPVKEGGTTSSPMHRGKTTSSVEQGKGGKVMIWAGHWSYVISRAWRWSNVLIKILPRDVQKGPVLASLLWGFWMCLFWPQVLTPATPDCFGHSTGPFVLLPFCMQPCLFDQWLWCHL